MRGHDGATEDLPVTRCALAMLENQDDNVGRVLAKLDALGLRENTIVVYFSDNGPNSWRWNGGMKGRKGSVDEGGIRSPAMVSWPARIKPGTVVKDISGAIDLLPTLTALAGFDGHQGVALAVAPRRFADAAAGASAPSVPPLSARA